VSISALAHIGTRFAMRSPTSHDHRLIDRLRITPLGKGFIKNEAPRPALEREAGALEDDV